MTASCPSQKSRWELQRGEEEGAMPRTDASDWVRRGVIHFRSRSVLPLQIVNSFCEMQIVLPLNDDCKPCLYEHVLQISYYCYPGFCWAEREGRRTGQCPRQVPQILVAAAKRGFNNFRSRSVLPLQTVNSFCEQRDAHCVAAE